MQVGILCRHFRVLAHNLCLTSSVEDIPFYSFLATEVSVLIRDPRQKIKTVLQEFLEKFNSLILDTERMACAECGCPLLDLDYKSLCASGQAGLVWLVLAEAALLAAVLAKLGWDCVQVANNNINKISGISSSILMGYFWPNLNMLNAVLSLKCILQ